MTTILLIDDDALVVDALECLVMAWGYQAVAAGSEEEAVAKLQDGPAPDLQIVDWRLRDGRTGGQAIDRVQMMFQRTIPAIVVTGETAVERLHEIEAQGCPVVHKPVAPATLKALVERALNGPDLREPSTGTSPVF